MDALDTRSGRAAQVRVLFTGPGWDEEALAGAVSRWCSLGVSEACGVLDFGAHGDRWFLVVPPSLGMPLERWRMVRRPSALDAARLTLAFGRVLERVAQAGFPADGLAMLDLAVGPGPTPFLERPLLGDPGAGPAGDPRGGPAVARGDRDRRAFRRAGGRARPLARRRAQRVVRVARRVSGCPRGDGGARSARQPVGALDADLAGLFDEDDDLRLESLLPPAGERRGLRRAGAAVGIVLALRRRLGGARGRAAERLRRPPAPAAPPAAEPVPVDPGTLVNASDPPPRRHAHHHARPDAAPRLLAAHRPAGTINGRPRCSTRRRPRRRLPRLAADGHRRTAASRAADAARATGGGGATLPDPGGVTTLPPPAP